MRLPSDEVPQANNFENVLKVPEIVANGGTTYQAIANAIGKVERQGRYYRLGAELLGLIENGGRNHAVLTAAGRRFLTANRDERNRIAAEAVLSTRAIQRVIPYLEAHPKGITREQFKRFLDEIAEPTIGESMTERRESSMRAWMLGAGLIKQDAGKILLTGKLPPSIRVVDYEDDEPLAVPKGDPLQTYSNVAARMREQKGTVQRLIDSAAIERALDSHRTVTNLVADKIRRTGSVPKRNRFIDLAATVNEESFLFEIKSTTSDNFHSQIRLAVSQLYEYRYLHTEFQEARLVIVTENAPPKKDEWLVDYLLADRALLLAWDGSGDRLFCPTGIAKHLHFLTG